MTLDEIFAYCKELGEEDYRVLITKLKEEENNRARRLQKEAWNLVIKAIDTYNHLYGDIIITDNRDGEGIVLSSNDWTSSLGLIEVE